MPSFEEPPSTPRRRSLTLTSESEYGFTTPESSSPSSTPSLTLRKRSAEKDVPRTPPVTKGPLQVPPPPKKKKIRDLSF